MFAYRLLVAECLKCVKFLRKRCSHSDFKHFEFEVNTMKNRSSSAESPSSGLAHPLLEPAIIASRLSKCTLLFGVYCLLSGFMLVLFSFTEDQIPQTIGYVLLLVGGFFIVLSIAFTLFAICTRRRYDQYRKSALNNARPGVHSDEKTPLLFSDSCASSLRDTKKLKTFFVHPNHAAAVRDTGADVTSKVIANPTTPPINNARSSILVLTNSCSNLES